MVAVGTHTPPTLCPSKSYSNGWRTIGGWHPPRLWQCTLHSQPPHPGGQLA